MQVLYQNRAITLEKDNVIGVGGEATVFCQPRISDVAFKVYHEHNKQRSEKLQAFAQRNFSLPKNVIQPQQLLFDKQKQIIGYTMTQLPPGWHSLAMLATRKFCQNHNITSKDILKLFIQLHKTLSSVHKTGLVVGDLNDQNELIRPGQNIHSAWIDVDSWQFGTYPCLVGTEKYVSPDLYGVDLSQQPRFLPHHDWYSFVVLLFRSLLRIHPFQSGFHRTYKSLTARAKHGITVFDNEVKKPRFSLPPELVPDELLETLLAFLKRKRIDSFPLQELEQSISVMVECPSCKLWYAGTRSTCPGCATKNVYDMQLQRTVSGISAREIIRTQGTIIHTEVVGDTIQCFANENGMTVLYSYSPYGKNRQELFATIPGARLTLFGDKLVICPEPNAIQPNLLLLDIASQKPRPFGQTTTDVFAGGQAVFACSSSRLYRIVGSNIVCAEVFGNQLAEREVLQILPGQTWFTATKDGTADRDYLFGFYRIFNHQRWFLVRREKDRFIRNDLKLTELRHNERIVDISIKPAKDSVLIVRKTLYHGIEYVYINVVSHNGSTTVSKRISIADTPRYDDLHAGAYAHGHILHITDDGIVRERVQDNQQTTFKGTKQYIRPGDTLLLYQNQVAVISYDRVVLLKK